MDITNTNIGCEAGAVKALKKKTKKESAYNRLFIPQNELPFRAIFKAIVGTTRSPTTFIGPQGKLCGSSYHDLPQVKFELISCLLDNYLPAEAMDNLRGN